MNDLFGQLEQLLGSGLLAAVAVLVAAYYVALGLLKLVESIRSVSARQVELQERRLELEVLKLELEIRALRAATGLRDDEPKQDIALHSEVTNRSLFAVLSESLLLRWCAWLFPVILTSSMGVLIGMNVGSIGYMGGGPVWILAGVLVVLLFVAAAVGMGLELGSTIRRRSRIAYAFGVGIALATPLVVATTLVPLMAEAVDKANQVPH